MQKWEYLYVDINLDSDKQWKPMRVDGQELRDWKHGPFVYEYTRQLGEQGWEMAAAPSIYLLIFKRPKQ